MNPNYLLFKVSVLQHATEGTNCSYAEDILTVVCNPQPTPTCTNTPTSSNTPTPTPSITATATVTPSITPTISITPSITATVSLTPSITPTNTQTPTPTTTPTPTLPPVIPPLQSISIDNDLVWLFNTNEYPVLIQSQRSDTNGMSWQDIGPFVNVVANGSSSIFYNGDTNTKYRSRAFSLGAGTLSSPWSNVYIYTNPDAIAAPIINYDFNTSYLYIFNVNDVLVNMIIEKSEDGIVWQYALSTSESINANTNKSFTISGTPYTKFRALYFSAGLGYSVSSWSYTDLILPTPTSTRTPTPTITPTSTSNFINSLTILSGSNYISGNGLTFSGNTGDRIEYIAQNGYDLPSTMNISVGGIIKATVIFPASIYNNKLFKVTISGIPYIGNFIAGNINFI